MSKVLSTLDTLQKKYPSISFKEGKLFSWSPKDTTVIYTLSYEDEDHAVWALIHEVAHGVLNHKHYKNDIDLLRHEVDAWHNAKDIANSIHISIDDNHIQDCLDTYRDWLHKRATCPNCSVVGLQQDNGYYGCFNCQTRWKVPDSPLCRVSRVVISE
jgi:hypothetical protein